MEATRDPERLAIAEVNPRMPRVDGIPELGGNRVHTSEVDVLVEHEADLVTLPPEEPSAEDLAIAQLVCDRIQPASILQFGIGAIPDAIARILAERAGGGFGIHTEMISDGVMRLHEAGKVTNRKPRYPGAMLATATHDHKRGEDVRARLAVLSELPHEWAANVRTWMSLNAPHRRMVDGPMPSPGDSTRAPEVTSPSSAGQEPPPTAGASSVSNPPRPSGDGASRPSYPTSGATPS